MTSSPTETPTWQQPDLLGDLEVCLECFNVRGSFEGKEHRCRCVPTDDRWREREWGTRDIAALVDLCHLCARSTMKSGSRWSWYACETCLDVNRAVGAVFGNQKAGALPLGRHSLMNGVSLDAGNHDDAATAGFVDLLRGLTKVWKRIFEWAPQEAGRRAASAGWASGEGAVPLVEWLERLPASRGASADAFCRFVEYDLPEHAHLEELAEARRSFLSAGSVG